MDHVSRPGEDAEALMVRFEADTAREGKLRVDEVDDVESPTDPSSLTRVSEDGVSCLGVPISGEADGELDVAGPRGG